MIWDDVDSEVSEDQVTSSAGYHQFSYSRGQNPGREYRYPPLPTDQERGGRLVSTGRHGGTSDPYNCTRRRKGKR